MTSVNIERLVRAMIKVSDHLSDEHQLQLAFPSLQLEHSDVTRLAELQAELLIPPEHVATMLGVSTKTLANWRCRGTEGPKHVSIGSRIAYRRKDVIDFIAACVRQSTSETKGLTRAKR